MSQSTTADTINIDSQKPTKVITLNEAYNEVAATRLVPFQNRAMRRRMRNKRFRSRFFDELAMHVCSSPVCRELGVTQALYAAGADDDISQISFGIDPEKLAAFLDVIYDFIVNKLPGILEVILPLFMSISGLLLVLCLPASASAQQCDGPQCRSLPLWQPPEQLETLPPSEGPAPSMMPPSTPALAQSPEWQTVAQTSDSRRRQRTRRTRPVYCMRAALKRCVCRASQTKKRILCFR